MKNLFLVVVFIGINFLLVFLVGWIGLSGQGAIHGSGEGLAMVSAVFMLPLLVLGIALVVLGIFYKIHILHKFLPFIFIVGGIIPTVNLSRKGPGSDPVLGFTIFWMANVFCLLIIYATISNLFSHRRRKTS